ncbi:MAG: YidC/Oxa1 family membrane protein insertase [Eubacteriales bacterium]
MSSLFDIINIPFSYVIRFFYMLTDNYMVSLLLFAIVVKVVLFPIGIKTQKNMIKQASLRPKEMAIRAKYAGRDDKATQQKMQNEIMTLYQNENYNPAGGCLPMLIQLLVIWAIYQIVYGPLTYLCGMSADALTMLRSAVGGLLGTEKYVGNEIQILNDITKLGIPAVIEALGSVEGATAEIISGIENVLVNHWPNMTVFGGALDLSATPSLSLNILLLIPILNLVTTWLTPKLTRKMTYQAPGQEQADASMKIMNLAMPLMIFYMAFKLPAALGVYWIFQNILGVLQQFILSKIYPFPTFTEEEMKAAVKAVNKGEKAEKKSGGNGSSGSGGKQVRSLHHIDDDDYPEPPKPAGKNGKKKQLPKPVSDETAEAENEDGAAAAEKTEDGEGTEEASGQAEAADVSGIAPAPLKEDRER